LLGQLSGQLIHFSKFVYNFFHSFFDACKLAGNYRVAKGYGSPNAEFFGQVV